MNISLEDIINLPPEKKVDHYCFNYKAKLGQGSFSNVYAGFDEENGNIVAIKTINNKVLMDDYLYKALLAEIDIMKKLNHPNLVRFYNLVNTVNNVYVVTEYCNGGDLSSLISSKNGLNEPEALLVMSDILKGMKELIKHKIIHRDLKPANIFIKDGVFKIGDFGFAKQFQEGNNERSLNPIVGSPYYMPPKYLESGIFSIKHDIWSLGVMFYEILYGEIPWPSRSRDHLIKNIYTKPLYFPKHVEVSVQSQRFITRCLQINEDDRISWEEIFKSDLFFMGQNKENYGNFVKKTSFNLKKNDDFVKKAKFAKGNEDNFSEAENSKKETVPSDSDVDCKILEKNDYVLNVDPLFNDDNFFDNSSKKKVFHKNKPFFSQNVKKLSGLLSYIEFLDQLRILLKENPQRKSILSLEKAFFLVLKNWVILSCYLSELETENTLDFDDWDNFKRNENFREQVSKIQMTNDQVFSLFIQISEENTYKELAKFDNKFAKVYCSDIMNENKPFCLISDYFIVSAIKDVNDYITIANIRGKLTFKEEFGGLVRVLNALIEYHNLMNFSLQKIENNEGEPFAFKSMIQSLDFEKINRDIREFDYSDVKSYLGLKIKVQEINP